jgi:hypothetical protein
MKLITLTLLAAAVAFAAGCGKDESSDAGAKMKAACA